MSDVLVMAKCIIIPQYRSLWQQTSLYSAKKQIDYVNMRIGMTEKRIQNTRLFVKNVMKRIDKQSDLVEFFRIFFLLFE